MSSRQPPHVPVDSPGASGILASLTTESRARWRLEMLIVLGVSLGESAAYSVLSILDKLTRTEALNQQTTTINTSVAPDRGWLDLSWQVVNLIFPLVPVVLALYLLTLTRDADSIGFNRDAPGADLLRGLGTAAAVGVPGLILYLVARNLGLNTQVVPADLAAHWWTIPILILAAAMNGVTEEVIMVGFLFNRMRKSGHSFWGTNLTSAVIRGSYHLYQGFGGFVGNLLMGLLFGWLQRRWGRVMPLVVAHTLIDIVAFVGYPLLAPLVAWL